jgi:putative ABC transport system permease protein
MSLLDDFRHALRALSHRKAFSVVAALTLAIGVGSATLMFALVSSVLLEPLSVRESDRLIVAWKRTPEGTFSHYPFGADAVAEVKQHARSFEGVSAFSYNGAMRLPAIEHEAASYLTAGVVDGDFFHVIGVAPLLGRTLTPSDDVSGAERVLVIDERLWQRRYGKAADVIGRRLRLFDQAFTIVGVVPAVDLPKGSQAWLTLRAAESSSTDPASREAMRRDQDLVARVRPGVAIADATAELEALTAEYGRRDGRPLLASIKPYQEEVIGDVKTPVLALFGATLLVLLIACANLANLLLVRGEDRRAEYSLRSALGAGSSHLVRQIAVEALVLCAVGGSTGVLIAQASLGLLSAFAPADWPRMDGLQINNTVALFALIATLLAAVVATIVPAIAAARVGGSVLSGGNTRVTSPAFRRSRRTFVIMQIALAVTILAAAGLLSRTLLQLRSVEMGFAADRLAFVELLLPQSQYRDPAVRREFFETLAARVRSLPGVEAVTPVAVRPYAGLSGWDMPNWVAEGQGVEDAGRNPGLDLQSIYPEHFETMRIPIVEGRAISQFDRKGSVNVAVISADAAAQVWPGESAIGKRIKWGRVDSDAPWFTVVGIAATTRYRELAQPRESLYLSAAQFVDGADTLALRLSVPLASIAPAVRQSVQTIDRGVFIVRAQAFSQFAAGPLSRPRFVSFLGNIFGVTALLLATVGLYGVMSVFVRQSRREIGVRIALGASAVHVRSLVAGEAARLAGVGIVMGLAGAIATGQLVKGLLFGVPPIDAVTLGGSIAVLCLAAAAACYVPLRTATAIDPVTLLRAD